MPNSEYKLRYLPLFYEDLNEKVEYIAFEKLIVFACVLAALLELVLEMAKLHTKDCCLEGI